MKNIWISVAISFSVFALIYFAIALPSLNLGFTKHGESAKYVIWVYFTIMTAVAAFNLSAINGAIFWKKIGFFTIALIWIYIVFYISGIPIDSRDASNEITDIIARLSMVVFLVSIASGSTALIQSAESVWKAVIKIAGIVLGTATVFILLIWYLE